MCYMNKNVHFQNFLLQEVNQPFYISIQFVGMFIFFITVFGDKGHLMHFIENKDLQ